jgi:hypothetical protein
MGRKGVSKRKSKKAKPFSNNNVSNSSTRQGDNSPVQSLVKDRVTLNEGGNAANKKNRKGK